jgi:hypothetical protein
MVLSGTKRTSSISSIVNQDQGGGMKKGGLAPTETASVAQANARRSAGGISNLSLMNTLVAGSDARSHHRVGRPMAWH